MNCDDPETAHRVVADYARLLERGDGQSLPAPVRLLPHPKPMIKAAILTCASALARDGRLTPDMRDFLEQAYVALADYVDDDLVRVMTEYRQSLDEIAGLPGTREKQQTPAWRRIVETGRLAGEIARSLADEGASLRLEFRTHAAVPSKENQR